MSAAVDDEFYKKTLKRILDLPTLYSDTHIEPLGKSATVPRPKHPKTLTLKALGRQDSQSVTLTPYMNVGDIRKRAFEWLECLPGDTMRLLMKGKALCDDSQKLVDLQADGVDLTINVIVKKQVQMGEEFFKELDDLLNRYGVSTELAGRVRSLLGKQ